MYGAGAAPRANIIPLRVIGIVNSTQEVTARALEYNVNTNDTRQIHVSNNSWGYGFPATLLEDPAGGLAINKGQTEGRDGKGIVYVFASGNSRSTTISRTILDGIGGITDPVALDFCSYEPYPNMPGTIIVGSIDDNGIRTSYSEGGTNLLVVAQGGSSETTGGSITADVTGQPGYSQIVTTGGLDAIAHDGNYTLGTDGLDGTSFAAPIVSGLAAQLLSIRPDLSHYDVMHILVESAMTVGQSDGNYIQNASGKSFALGYGFGLIDAPSAISLAQDWELLPSRGELIGEWEGNTNEAPTEIPDFGKQRDILVTINKNPDEELVLDELFLDIHASHAQRGELEITIVSPSGTFATIPPRIWDDETTYDTTFRILNFWGEDPEGTWRVTIRDTESPNSGGDLFEVTLRANGWVANKVPQINFISSSSFTTNAIFPSIDSAEGIDATEDVELFIEGENFTDITRISINNQIIDNKTFVDEGEIRVIVPNELIASIGANEVIIEAATPSYQGLGGGVSEPYYGSIETPRPHIISSGPIFVEEGDTWIYSPRVSQALFGNSTGLVFEVAGVSSNILINNDPALSVTRSGINTFLIRSDLNPRYGALAPQSQFYVDIKVSSVTDPTLFDIQRCVVTVTPPDDMTSTAVGQNVQDQNIKGVSP